MTQSTVVFALFRDDALPAEMAKAYEATLGELSFHTFPDEETVVTLHTPVQGCEVIFVADLARPNSKMLPLQFAAETARSLGAKKITLIAPYLPYMRQDKVFEVGQGITSAYFAKWMSSTVDTLITVDPHLHRWHALKEIYSIPSTVLHATNKIAEWVKTHVQQPLLIGPDSESQQWVSAVAEQCGAPYVVLEKHRLGDRDIEVSLPNLSPYEQYTPVLVDDIISTGMTVLGLIQQLASVTPVKPVLVGVHAVFSGDAYATLLASGLSQVVTCNTIPHPSNQIDLASLFFGAI